MHCYIHVCDKIKKKKNETKYLYTLSCSLIPVLIFHFLSLRFSSIVISQSIAVNISHIKISLRINSFQSVNYTLNVFRFFFALIYLVIHIETIKIFF